MNKSDKFTQYRRILSTAKWSSQNNILVPINVKNWLLESGSLTKRLQLICSLFEVEVINEYYLESNDRKNSDLFSSAWLREVLLKGDNTHWIFAQTLFSKSIMDRMGDDIKGLNNNPIGLWLFPKQPTRISLEWYQDPETLLYARCSILSLGNDYIEIKELFLDDFKFI